MDRSYHRNQLTHDLRRRGNCLPWAYVMEQALYHRQWGYYTLGPSLGRGGDFFTPSHIGTTYPNLLAEWLVKLREFTGKPWSYVELGPGEGRWLQYIRRKADLDARLCWAVEKSPAFRERLRNQIPPSQVVASLDEIPPQSAALVVACEFFDAMPIHPVRYQGTKRSSLREAYVTWADSKWRWVWKKSLSPDIQVLWETWISDFPPGVLTTGQVIEIPQAALCFMGEVARWLKRSSQGLFFILDYMRPRCELLVSREGTLRAYHGHRLLTRPSEWLSYLGEVDLTSTPPVDLLRRVGEGEGLVTVWDGTQGSFLGDSGVIGSLAPPPLSDPFSPAAREWRKFLQLFHPGAMGESFRVLLQGWHLEIPGVYRVLFPSPNECES
ncbi:SAM-dependent methyltransferase [Pasteuria penetrans]|uniref:SAM-dependent methyltransferase n=1 Tax=Pasteuria penetrans TaxID=86005 RepID=UPI000FAA4B0C|nr:SAM-dependent methyltransferase [Pasteuria penetrans]